MPFEDLTLEKLRAATKEQIITAINNKLQAMTKKNIIILVLRLVGVDIDTYELLGLVELDDGPNGQVRRRWTTTDVLGNKLKSLSVDWTYYPAGPVDEITIKWLDAADAVTSTRIIKHFIDGRQPIVLK